MWSLRLRGYRILARRYRSPVGEIDIVAQRGRTLVAAEVKARRVHAEAVAAVLPRQQNRIANAMAHFLSRQPRAGDLAIRFDVIVVRPRRWPVHVVDAWRPAGGRS